MSSNPLHSIQHRNILKAVRALADHVFGNPPPEKWQVPHTAIITDCTAKDGFDWDQFYRQVAEPLELPKATHYMVFASTGCSCCRDNNWAEHFTSLESAWHCAQASWDCKSVASQYAERGVYSIHEIEVEILPGDRLVFGSSVLDFGVTEYGRKANDMLYYVDSKHIHTVRDKVSRDKSYEQYREEQNEKT